MSCLCHRLAIFFLLQDWIHFLNKGSQVNISYSVKSLSTSVFLVIAQGMLFFFYPIFKLLLMKYGTMDSASLKLVIFYY